MKRVSVAIVEPSPIVMEGVAKIAAHSHNIRVAGAVASLAELQSLMRNVEVDVVVAAVGLANDLEGVTEIGDYAFYAPTNCPKNIYIPKSVLTIEDWGLYLGYNYNFTPAIYCEVEAPLNGWDKYWTSSNYVRIFYGCSEIGDI